MVLYAMLSYGVVWYSTVQYDVGWYGMKWYNMISNPSSHVVCCPITMLWYGTVRCGIYIYIYSHQILFI
jgi:hypothetical protein